MFCAIQYGRKAAVAEDFFKVACQIIGANPTAPPLPDAWMGMAERFKKPTALVCAWCPDKDKADRLAESRGLDVSHGVCSACLKKMMTDRFYEHHET
jgi:hypothetical protein